MAQKIAVMHYADVRNYGDVLFPHIIKWQLEQQLPQATFDFFGPTHDPCGTLASRRFDTASPDGYDAIVIGGGEIVHLGDAGLVEIYGQLGQRSIPSPSDMVFGWSNWRARYKAWIALGVPPADEATLLAIKEAAKGLDAMSVRGSLSAKQVARTTIDCDLKTVPDIGWLIPDFARHHGWQLSDALASELNKQPYIVFQALPWWDTLRESGDYIVGVLRAIQASGLRVVLLPITDYCNDYGALSWINDKSGGDFLLLDPSLEYEKRGVVLMGARYYLGQSLHGVITALASGIPAGAIVPKQGHQKFVETLEDIGLGHLRVETWNELDDLAAVVASHDRTVISEKAQERRAALAAHFDEMAVKIRNGRRWSASAFFRKMIRPLRAA